MKITLDIELDWIDEDMSLNDAVTEQVVNGIIDKISDKSKSAAEKLVEDKIDKLIVDKIDKLTDDMFKDFTTRPVSLTDNYGSVVHQYDSMTDLIKERFDNFMTQTVNEKGESYSGTYGKKTPRLKHIIEKQLTEFADAFTKDAVEQVSEEIKNHVSEGLTTKLGSELMQVLKVDQMLKIDSK